MADAAKLINLPEDEVILREYVERLQEYPADVLERAVRRVAETYEYKTPPRVGTFMRHINADIGYQRTRAAMNKLTLIKQTAPLPSRQAESEEEGAKGLAGVKELIGHQAGQKGARMVQVSPPTPLSVAPSITPSNPCGPGAVIPREVTVLVVAVHGIESPTWA